VNYDDEILMAYADGELDEAKRAEIAAAITQDAGLARRVEKHRALRAEISSAFDGVLRQPVPDHLQAAARGMRAAEPATRGNIVRFPARGTRTPPAPWSGRQWAAMAASLVLGMFLSWKFLAPGGGAGSEIVSENGSLVARGEFARALDTQLASDQSAESSVYIGLTFPTKEGRYCRSFVLRDSSTAGLACHDEQGWRIPVMQSVPLQGGDLRQAAAGLTPAILAAISERAGGEALDAAGERAARDAQWLSQ
jgi:hypothetical protein